MLAGSIAGVSVAMTENGIISRIGKAKRKIRAARIANAKLCVPPISRALSTIALSEGFSKHCVCIWVLLICVRLAVELPATKHHLLNTICLMIAGLLLLSRIFIQ